jgi:hypothetical protein
MKSIPQFLRRTAVGAIALAGVDIINVPDANSQSATMKKSISQLENQITKVDKNKIDRIADLIYSLTLQSKLDLLNGPHNIQNVDDGASIETFGIPGKKNEYPLGYNYIKRFSDGKTDYDYYLNLTFDKNQKFLKGHCVYFPSSENKTETGVDIMIDENYNASLGLRSGDISDSDFRKIIKGCLSDVTGS